VLDRNFAARRVPEAEFERSRTAARAAAKPPGIAPENEQDGRPKSLAETPLAKKLGPRYEPNRVRIRGFEIYDDRQRDVIKRLQGLDGRLPEMTREGHGLIFFGTVGTGKDRMLARMLYVALGRHQIDCDWFNGEDLYAQMREQIRNGASEEDLIAGLCKPRILAVSDALPVAGDLSDWNTRVLARTVDRRYRAKKATWMTLNAMSIEDADSRLSAPVFDRLREDAEVFRCFWQSYREWKSLPRP